MYINELVKFLESHRIPLSEKVLRDASLVTGALQMHDYDGSW